jgi:hypothetical protein
LNDWEKKEKWSEGLAFEQFGSLKEEKGL